MAQPPRAVDPTIPLMPGANSVEEVRQLAATLHPEAVAAGVELIETDEPEMLLEALRSFP